MKYHEICTCKAELIGESTDDASLGMFRMRLNEWRTEHRNCASRANAVVVAGPDVSESIDAVLVSITEGAGITTSKGVSFHRWLDERIKNIATSIAGQVVQTYDNNVRNREIVRNRERELAPITSPNFPPPQNPNAAWTNLHTQVTTAPPLTLAQVADVLARHEQEVITGIERKINAAAPATLTAHTMSRLVAEVSAEVMSRASALEKAQLARAQSYVSDATSSFVEYAERYFADGGRPRTEEGMRGLLQAFEAQERKDEDRRRGKPLAALKADQRAKRKMKDNPQA